LSRSRRQPPRRTDPISAFQETLDTQEARRAKLVRYFALATAGLLVIGAVVAVVASGNPAQGSRDSAASQSTPAPVVIAEPPAQPTATPAEEPGEDAGTDSAALLDLEPTVPDTSKSPATKPKAKPAAPTSQSVRIAIGVTGYSPSTVTASAASPLKLSVDRGEGCAAGFLIPELDIAEDNSAGPITIDLGTVPAGTYQFSCGMEMVTGTLIVK